MYALLPVVVVVPFVFVVVAMALLIFSVSRFQLSKKEQQTNSKREERERERKRKRKIERPPTLPERLTAASAVSSATPSASAHGQINKGNICAQLLIMAVTCKSGNK